jgi:uncharacterized protein (DUF885 family)
MRCSPVVPAIVLAGCALACGSSSRSAPASTPPATAQSPAPAAPAVPPAAPAAPAAPDDNAALDALFAEYDAGVLARSPVAQSERGIKTDHGKWDDFSDEQAARNSEADAAALAAMRARFVHAALDDAHRLSYRLFEDRIERQARSYRFRDHAYVFDQMNGAQSRLPAFLINIHKVTSAGDAEAYVQRLQGLRPALRQLIAVSASRAAKGFSPPRWVYPFVVSDARNVLQGAPFDRGPDSTLLGDFKTKLAALELSPEDTRRLTAAAVTAKLPQWFTTLPRAPLVVKPVEAFREKSAGKAFYQRPAPDGSRPGTYYVNLYDMAAMPAMEVEALVYHEGIPGHHLQLAVQTELANLPAFRKFGGVTAYSEGWGLYAEKLAKDMGQYTDPVRDFGRLQLELHRAIRLVVDTGLHAKQWTREQAIRYVLDNSAEPKPAAAKAIERYIVMPGQATAYMVGRLKISELRERARAALGDRFDIRAFHEVVLRNGPVPLDLLDTEVTRWIESQRS